MGSITKCFSSYFLADPFLWLVAVITGIGHKHRLRRNDKFSIIVGPVTSNRI